MDSSPESPRLMFSTICGMRPPSATIEIVDACSTACRTLWSVAKGFHAPADSFAAVQPQQRSRRTGPQYGG